MPAWINVILFAALSICWTSDCFADKWLPLDHIKSAPKAKLERSAWSHWIDNTTRSMFLDGENWRRTQESYDASQAANPKTIRSFELLDRNMSFGQQQALNDLFLAFSEREVQKIDFFQSFKGGLNFKWDFKESTKKSQPTAPKINDPIRYGLVVKGIKPSEDQHLTAALGHENYHLIDSAPKAQVLWGIEKKVLKNVPRNPYQVSIEPDRTIANPYLSWFHKRIIDPITSLKISGNVRPHNPDPKATAGQGLPPQVISLNQDNGIYSLQLITNSDLEPEQMLHVIQVDLGGVVYRNEMNMDWDVQKVSLLGIAAFKNVSANIHHIIEAERYQSEIAIHGPGQIWSLRTDTTIDFMDEWDHDSHFLELGLTQYF
ncbi:hypothetical protein SAMN06296036_101375 [Pseudobacteriovorax antillogorgiicola]|uniref:Uncharacterized protein n=2 Tax=Pseudobacteriovorax antillogorgiicola TaxID=1513793 RepID=A0A1Y6B405_9BACT|nr:hypothetical protein EDD56_101111 [Pseudobacteriovorax antillogorgiicola]SME90564.1 hypothetical protein SAMN06296036_101375 [Pseudobacteriovorax antillogorgiicola]